MNFWITFGDTLHPVVADDVDQAFDLMARHFGHTDFEEMRHALGLSWNDFSVSRIEVAPRAECGPAGDRSAIQQEEKRTLLGAFTAAKRAVVSQGGR